MKAILFLCFFLLMAVTTSASAAVHIAPSHAGNVVAGDSTLPVHTLDLKDAAADAGLSEYVLDTHGRRVDPSSTQNARWRLVEDQRLPIQKSQSGLFFGWVHYPLRN